MKAARAVGWALVAALAVTFAINVRWIAHNWSALRPVGGGAEAPTFALPLLAGGRYQLAPGRVAVLDFWASWCPPCRAEMPTLDKLAARYRDRGVDVVAVNVENEDARADVAAFARDNRLTLPIAVGGGPVAERYKVETLPHLVIVDASGKVARVLVGESSEADLVAAIDAVNAARAR